MSNLFGKSCLVFGATGFIGWNLCRGLVAQGARIRAVAHRTLSDEQRQGPGIDWIRGSLLDRDFVSRAVAGQSLVFHLVSSSSPGSYNTNPSADLQENVAPTLQLAELSLVAGVERIVFASSGGTVYGVGRESVLTEASATNPISAYGVGKLATEKYLEIFWRHLGLKSSILRISNPYGPYQNAAKGQGLIGKIMNCALQGEAMTVWGDGSIVRDFIYIDDVVSALVAVTCYDGAEQVFNVGSGIGASVNDIIAAVERTTGLNVAVDYQPGRAADVPMNILDTTLIRTRLGWSPRVSLEDGLRLTYQWNLARQSN